jgi:hypothetical protein
MVYYFKNKTKYSFQKAIEFNIISISSTHSNAFIKAFSSKNKKRKAI